MGCWQMVIQPVHGGSSSILKVRFFGRPCIFTWIFKAPFQDQGPHKLLPPGHCLQSRICKQRHLSRIFTRGSQLCRIFARRASQLWNQGFSARFFLGRFKQYLGLLQYFVTDDHKGIWYWPISLLATTNDDFNDEDYDDSDCPWLGSLAVV